MFCSLLDFWTSLKSPYSPRGYFIFQGSQSLANTAPDTSARVLEQQLDGIQSELIHAENNATRLNFMMSLLENYTRVRLGVDPFRGGTPGGEVVGLDVASETFDFYSTRSQQLHRQLAEVSNVQMQLIEKKSQIVQSLKERTHRRSGLRRYIPSFHPPSWGCPINKMRTAKTTDCSDLSALFRIRNSFGAEAHLFF